MIRLDDDVWGREVWLLSGDEKDVYTVILDGVTSVTVIFDAGTSLSHVYNTIEAHLWTP